jgi:peptidoglycan/LPS O-acetylase OafA/YrhL
MSISWSPTADRALPSGKDKAKAKAHLSTIDALRGLAALAVCLFHIGGSVAPKISTSQTAAAVAWGSHGVDIFFVISGFVIPYVMLRGGYRWPDAPRFLARRFLRVAPPAFILLLLTITQFWFIDRFVVGDHWFGALTARQLLANFTFLVPFMGEAWINGVFWTLAVEFQYYIALALLFPLIVRSYGAALACAMLLLGMSSLTPGVTDFFDVVGCFILGGIVLAYKEQALSVRSTVALLLATTAVIALKQDLYAALFGAAAAGTLAAVTIDNRLLNFRGKISYSLYLTHILVASTGEFFLLKLVRPGNLASRCLMLLLLTGASIVAATIFYYLVERHFVALSHKVRSSAARPVAVAPPDLPVAAATDGPAALS